MYCGMEISCVIIKDAVTKVANITTNNTKGIRYRQSLKLVTMQHAKIHKFP